MNRPEISITEAIRIAVAHSRLENDDPYCVSALYEDDYISLVVYTLYQRYEFYVDAFSGEVSGIMSEPIDFIEDEEAEICA